MTTEILYPFDGVTPNIDPSAFVAPGAAVIGDVTIGAEASIWYGCVLRGDDHWIRVGPRTSVQDGTVIHVSLNTHPTDIGGDVVIGHGVRLHGCTLQDRCLIGIGAIVLDGAVIESGAIVAAGALVAPGKRVPGGELWVGNPARRGREINEEERNFLQWAPVHYVGLGAKHRQITARSSNAAPATAPGALSRDR